MQGNNVSVWDDGTTAQIIAMRTVKPNVGNGCYSLLRYSTDPRLAYVDCGGACVLSRGHVGDHECGADEPGEPGTCPA